MIIKQAAVLRESLYLAYLALLQLYGVGVCNDRPTTRVVYVCDLL